MADELLQQVKLQGGLPAHIAIIMDGNGRWAQARGLPRPLGHKAGMQAVRDVVEGALAAGVETITLFAFSQENWQRPAEEIGALMELLQEYIASEMAELAAEGVKVRFLGELERLNAPARAAVRQMEETTASGAKLALNICISYGSRAELTRAARMLAADAVAGRLDPSTIDEEMMAARLYTAEWPDPDLLIRTSGELRLSNFLLWQLAYAELHVTPVLWPDFNRQNLWEAILEYQRRDRRFGRVSV
ncbi:MAG TPA: isoprenyl transferase [Gemmatimonadales bacterium]|nr:isoprenyl transferase [Gemmatimonadales bacterium]